MRIRGKEKVAHLLQEASPIIHPVESGRLAPSHDEGGRTVALEVGCGRGSFICEVAQRHPDWQLIGVDKYTPILARAASRAMEMGLKNVRFIDANVKELAAILEPGSIDTLYLNFSDPWPRRRNHIKRLTHPDFLRLYGVWLKQFGQLCLKTDSRDLFEFSQSSLTNEGWSIHKASDQLPDEALIQTEYEQKFRALGLPIYYLHAQPNSDAMARVEL